MTRFPTAGHLVSWAGGTRHQRIGGQEERQELNRPRQRLSGRDLGNAAAAAAKTDTFLGDRYRRIALSRGSKRANVAVGRSILIIIWHLLSEPQARFEDLGPGYYAARTDPERRKRKHVRQLEALGYTVILKPAAWAGHSNPAPLTLRRELPRARALTNFRISSCLPAPYEQQREQQRR